MTTTTASSLFLERNWRKKSRVNVIFREDLRLKRLITYLISMPRDTPWGKHSSHSKRKNPHPTSINCSPIPHLELSSSAHLCTSQCIKFKLPSQATLPFALRLISVRTNLRMPGPSRSRRNTPHLFAGLSSFPSSKSSPTFQASQTL